MGQEGFLFSGKEKIGDNIGKKQGIPFFFETVYFFGSCFFFFHHLALSHFSCTFEHGAQGGKTTDITANNREKRLGCREGWISEPVIRAFSFFLGRGIGIGIFLGFGWDGL